MELWASVDVLNGKVVRLVKGSPKNLIVYGDDPTSAAQRWEVHGFDGIHIVDLDAALGTGDNLEHIKKVLRAVGIKVQVGGGIRSVERLRVLVDAGADRFVVSTIAFENPSVMKDMLEVVGSERLMLALDHREGAIVIRGWKEGTGMDVLSGAKRFLEYGIRMFLLTDVERDGTLSGTSIQIVSKVAGLEGISVYAAGGISSLTDLLELKRAKVKGVVLGRALYEGGINIEEAISVAR